MRLATLAGNSVHDSDRFRLLGSYETPRFEYGQVVFCERFGEVTIDGITDAPIPWPFTKRKSGRGGRPSLILFAGLVEAVRRESNQAVAYWWGVTGQTVTKWRKALEVSPTTEGTSGLRSEYALAEAVVKGRKRAHAKAQDPERRRKIAESKRGKPRPGHVVEALRAANVGRPLSAEHRAKIGAATRRNGTIPPKAGRLWTAEED